MKYGFRANGLGLLQRALAGPQTVRAGCARACTSVRLQKNLSKAKAPVNNPIERLNGGDQTGALKLADDPCTLRLYSQQALGGGKGHDRAPATPAPLLGERKLVAATEAEPWSGLQEIRFFGDQFGLVISDLNFEKTFDYEFVYEDLNFFHFRLSGQSLEQVSPGGEETLIDRPGFMLSAAPNGHVEKTRKLDASPWRSVAPFFDDEAIARILGDDGASLAEASAFLNAWRVRENAGLLPFSVSIAETLRAIVTCPFTDRLRHTYLEAKTVELICLAIAQCAQGAETAGEPPLSAQDRKRLEEARDILDAEYVNPPSLAALGRQVGLNRRKLATGFRLCFDISIMQYCLDKRMRAACVMLQEGVPIARVADAAGYADQASFSRAFRRHFGNTPGYFRAQDS